MKPWFDISAEPAYRLLQVFLFLLPFSIAGSYLLFTPLLLLWLTDFWRHGLRPPSPRWFIFLLVFAGLTLLSSIFSIAPLESFKDNRDLLTLLLVPVCLRVLRSPKRVAGALGAVLFSALLSALTGLVQAWRHGYSLDARLKGFTSHWMTYSGLLMMALVFFLVAVLLREKRWPGWLLLLSLGLMGVALLLGETRSAWLGAGLAMFLFIVFMRPKALLMAAPLLAGLLFLLPAPVRQRMASIVNPDDPSNRTRIQMMHSGWRLFLDHPLTGVGSNAVPRAIADRPERYLHPEADRSLQHPHLHNNFLQLLAERGIFSLLAFLAFCFEAVRDLARRTRRATPGMRFAPAGGLFAFVAFLVAGLFEFNFGDAEVRFLMLFFLAQACAGSPGEAHDQPEES